MKKRDFRISGLFIKFTSVVPLSLSLISLLSFSACSDSDCVLTNSVMANFKLYEGTEGLPVTIMDTLTIKAIRPQGDTVIINRETELTSFSLPLSYTSDRDVFVLCYNDSLCDSLYIYHTNRPVFISMECGTAIYHTITDIKSDCAAMDSVTIANSSVDNNGNTNIKIYYTLSE